MVHISTRIVKSDLVNDFLFSGLVYSDPVGVIKHTDLMVPKVEGVNISVTDPTAVFRDGIIQLPLRCAGHSILVTKHAMNVHII